MSLYGLGPFHDKMTGKTVWIGLMLALSLGFVLLAARGFHVEHWLVGLGTMLFFTYALLAGAIGMKKYLRGKSTFDAVTEAELRGFGLGVIVLSFSTMFAAVVLGVQI